MHRRGSEPQIPPEEVKEPEPESKYSTITQEAAASGRWVDYVMTKLTQKENKDALRQKKLFNKFGDPREMLEHTKRNISGMNFQLERILKDGGVCPNKVISAEFEAVTTVDIHEYDVEHFYELPLKGRTLPLKLFLNHKVGHGSPYADDLPEELTIYVSMNHAEPGPEGCDKKIDRDHIQLMNAKGKKHITIGSEKSRKQ